MSNKDRFITCMLASAGASILSFIITALQQAGVPPFAQYGDAPVSWVALPLILILATWALVTRPK